MEKQAILNEFSSFLDEIRNQYVSPGSVNPLERMKNNASYINEQKLIDKANELLNYADNADFEDVKSDLVKLSQDFLKSFLLC